MEKVNISLENCYMSNVYVASWQMQYTTWTLLGKHAEKFENSKNLRVRA